MTCRMTFEEFKRSLSCDKPPNGLSRALIALWWDTKGEWARAHESARVDESEAGSWMHAYLHRKEGDQGNAAYWYRRAGKPVCRESLQTEWISLAAELLE